MSTLKKCVSICMLASLLCVLFVDGYNTYPRRSGRASIWGTCPTQCRCMALNSRGTRGVIEDWSSARLDGRTSGDEPNPLGRSMVCQGLRRLPKPIPHDVTKMTIYGDSSSQVARPSVPAGDGVQNDRVPLISDTQIRYITRDSFRGNARMQDMTLSGNNIGILYPNIFSSLRTLRVLSLPNNNIRHLSAAAFSGMTYLSELSMSDNMIRYLPQAIFRPLGNLRKLRLNGNKLRRLPRDILSPLTNVAVLDLSRNNFTDFYDEVFDDNTAMEELLLNGNRIWTVRARWFEKLILLRSLSLRGNAITRIESNSFVNLFNLEELLLSANHIAEIEDGAFRNLRDLRILDLATNDIEHITKEGLLDLESLEELYLSSNNIVDIENGTFTFLRRLTRLDLSRNHITEISTGVLRSLMLLQYLDMSHNKIMALPPRVLFGLSELKEISFDSNFIKTVGEDAFKTTPSTSVSKITAVSLQNNAIKEISAAALSSLPQLRTLNLGHNKIKRIHSMALSNFWNLQALDLSDNKIKNLNNGVFKNLQKVTNLDLSQNKLRRVSDTMLSGMSELEELDLSLNSITSISPLAFRYMQNLVELTLKSNRLMGFNFTYITNLPKLSIVDLSSNHLFWVDLSGNIQLRLRDLILTDNKINTVTQDVTKILAASSILSLTGNPLVCDCNMKWILDPVLTRKIRLDMESDLICKLPNRLHGLRIRDLDPNDLTCEVTDTHGDQGSFMCDDSHFRMRSLFNNRLGEKKILKRHVTIMDSLRKDVLGNGILVNDNWALVSGDVVGEDDLVSTMTGVKIRVGRSKSMRTVASAIRHPLTSWRQYNVALLRLDNTRNKKSNIESPCLMTEKQFNMISQIYPKITLSTRIGAGRSKLKPRHGKMQSICKYPSYLCVKIKGSKKRASEYMLLSGSPLFLGYSGDLNLAGIGFGDWNYVSKTSESLFIPVWTISEWISDVIREFDSTCSKEMSIGRPNQCLRSLQLPTSAALLAKIRQPESH
ncbi:insulin-like growth factor-binding protein complex acid labile subunit [Ylistrum balloti]|uniref:insulin-like growth factor-binding protein complex acid labile subunit n=1 Tax=Ylistrum balloti TaxID=509963 RepID=UPI002905EFCE|nr:insulin-like growth factor-binding protein complex acid labile subunit [Ylistrum balloti]